MQIYQKPLTVLKIYLMQRWEVETINLSYNILRVFVLLAFKGDSLYTSCMLGLHPFALFNEMNYLSKNKIKLVDAILCFLSTLIVI